MRANPTKHPEYDSSSSITFVSMKHPGYFVVVAAAAADFFAASIPFEVIFFES